MAAAASRQQQSPTSTTPTRSTLPAHLPPSGTPPYSGGQHYDGAHGAPRSGGNNAGSNANGSSSGNNTPSSNPRSAKRGPYKCGRCGQLLKGHSCPFKDYNSPHAGMPFMAPQGGMGAASPLGPMVQNGLFLPGASPMRMAAPYVMSEAPSSGGAGGGGSGRSNGHTIGYSNGLGNGLGNGQPHGPLPSAAALGSASSAGAGMVPPATAMMPGIPRSPMLLHPQFAAGAGAGAGAGAAADTHNKAGQTEDTSRVAALQLLSISKSAGVSPVDLSTDPLMRFMVRLSTNLGVPLATLDAVCREELQHALQAMPAEGSGGAGDNGAAASPGDGPAQRHGTAAGGSSMDNGAGHGGAGGAAGAGDDGHDGDGEAVQRQPQLSGTTVELVRTLLMQKRLFVKDQNSGAEVALDGVAEDGGTLQFVFGTSLEDEHGAEADASVDEADASVDEAGGVRGASLSFAGEGESRGGRAALNGRAAAPLEGSPQTPTRSGKRGGRDGSVEVVQPAKRSKGRSPRS